MPIIELKFTDARLKNVAKYIRDKYDLHGKDIKNDIEKEFNCILLASGMVYTFAFDTEKDYNWFLLHC